MADATSEAAFSRSFDAFTNPHRLAVMRELRSPKTLGEIIVREFETGAPLARQSVRRHLDVLLEAGIVLARPTQRERGDTLEYVVNHQRIFALSDELRGLARLRPVVDPSGETQPASGVEAHARGPCLVLLKGLDEGTRFDLDPAARSEWTIGRRRNAHVALDFDAATSAENSLITWIDGAHYVEDLPGSRNGTMVNLRRLASGDRVQLRHGDVLGVGRCYLVYWA